MNDLFSVSLWTISRGLWHERGINAPYQQHYQNRRDFRREPADLGGPGAQWRTGDRLASLEHARAGAFSVWVPPATGEQVAFVCIGGNPETAIIIGSLWSDDIPAPGSTLKEIIMTAPDGAVFRYDADAGALEVKGIKTASIQADTRITLDTSEVVCTRKLITATLEVQNGGEMRGSISHSGGSLTSNGITVHTHTHGGVRTGPGTTGGPQ